MGFVICDFRVAVGDRLMVGQQPLELRVRVRLLLPQLSQNLDSWYLALKDVEDTLFIIFQNADRK